MVRFSTQPRRGPFEDLAREYYALADAVASADGRVMTVKGWSVALSLAALGLGFQQSHYALFGLGAITAIAFWFLADLIKGHQVRHYSRLRDIEVAAHSLNAVELVSLARSHPLESTCPGVPKGKEGEPNVMFPRLRPSSWVRPCSSRPQTMLGASPR